MALIKCPECGNDISSKASFCPKCGCPASEFGVIECEQENCSSEETLKNESNVEIIEENTEFMEKITEKRKLLSPNGIDIEIYKDKHIHYDINQQLNICITKEVWASAYELIGEFDDYLFDEIDSYWEIFDQGMKKMSELYRKHVDSCLVVLDDLGLGYYCYELFSQTSNVARVVEKGLADLLHQYEILMRKNEEMLDDVEMEHISQARLIGGGIGIGGAITGMITASLINSVSDTINDMHKRRAIDNVNDQINSKAEKIFESDKPFDDLKNTFIGMCLENINHLGEILCSNGLDINILMTSDVNTSLEEIENQYEEDEIDENALYDWVIEVLQSEPFDMSIIKLLYETFGDEKRYLQNFVKYLGMENIYKSFVIRSDEEWVDDLEIQQTDDIEDLKDKLESFIELKKMNPYFEEMTIKFSEMDYRNRIDELIKENDTLKRKTEFRGNIEQIADYIMLSIDGKDATGEFLLKEYFEMLIEQDTDENSNYNRVIGIIDKWEGKIYKNNKKNKYRRLYLECLTCELLMRHEIEENSQEFNQCVKRIYELALEDINEAKAAIGYYLYYGKGGMLKNEKLAIDFYSDAAAHNSPHAMSGLGNIGLDHENPLVSRNEGIHNLKEASLYGDIRALNILKRHDIAPVTPQKDLEHYLCLLQEKYEENESSWKKLGIDNLYSKTTKIKKIYCKKCGGEIDQDASCCMQCGEKFVKEKKYAIDNIKIVNYYSGDVSEVLHILRELSKQQVNTDKNTYVFEAMRKEQLQDHFAWNVHTITPNTESNIYKLLTKKLQSILLEDEYIYVYFDYAMLKANAKQGMIITDRRLLFLDKDKISFCNYESINSVVFYSIDETFIGDYYINGVKEWKFEVTFLSNKHCAITLAFICSLIQKICGDDKSQIKFIAKTREEMQW